MKPKYIFAHHDKQDGGKKDVGKNSPDVTILDSKSGLVEKCSILDALYEQLRRELDSCGVRNIRPATAAQEMADSLL